MPGKSRKLGAECRIKHFPENPGFLKGFRLHGQRSSREAETENSAGDNEEGRQTEKP